MTFWIAAAILTLLATALIAVPLVRAPRAGAQAFDHDRALYRARMREIDADLKLGRIGEAEAEAARAEEGRKLIALSASDDAQQTTGRPRLARSALAMTVLFVPLAAVAFYFIEGVPNMPDMTIASRTDRNLSSQSITQLRERAEAQGIDYLLPEERLEVHPDDVARLGLRDGGGARISSRRGSIEVKVRATDKSPRGTVFASFAFDQTPINRLTGSGYDPVTMTAELKVCPVRVEALD